MWKLKRACVSQRLGSNTIGVGFHSIILEKGQGMTDRISKIKELVEQGFGATSRATAACSPVGVALF